MISEPELARVKATLRQNQHASVAAEVPLRLIDEILELHGALRETKAIAAQYWRYEDSPLTKIRKIVSAALGENE